MNPIEDILKNYSIMILDGALSTQLEKDGCDLKDDLWSAKILIENPEAIARVHEDYFIAGADCAITASYQATVEGFKRRGMSELESLELIKKSVYIATEVRDRFWENSGDNNRPKPIIAGSVGPYGAFLADGSEYRGDYQLSETELVDFHRPRIKALIEAGVDILACETFPCLLEAKAIVKLLEEFPGVYAWISFSAKDSFNISNGEKISNCAAWLDQVEQVAAIGINCTAPQYVNSLIEEVKKNTQKPIVVYPNSGEKYDATTHNWSGDSTDHSFCNHAQQWNKSGATVIGGCCRTGPEDIKAISDWIRGQN